MTVLALGNAEQADLSAIRGTIPSFYADPVGWLVVESVRAAVDGVPEVLEAKTEVGVILVSRSCTAHTMDQVARATSAGRLSPLRFAGASPGSAGSLACIVFGFRGPTLTLACDPADGLTTARMMATAWLRSGSAGHVLISTHQVDGGHHRVRTELLGPS